MNFKRLLVISDDLTGAMDVASSSLAVGVSPSIHTFSGVSYPDEIEELMRRNTNPVRIIATNLRYASQEDIRTALSKLKPLLSSEEQLIFLKLDSTARGAIGALLSGLIRWSDIEAVIFTPASPNLGRTVEDGLLYIGGELLESTHFARDPLSPRATSRLSEIIRLTSSPEITITEVSLRELMKGKLNLFAELIMEHHLLIIDAKHLEHLYQIAHLTLNAISLTSKRVAIAGSSALVPPLLDLLGTSRRAKLLFLLGTLNPVTLRQVEYWRDNGGRVIEFSPDTPIEQLTAVASAESSSLVIYSGREPFHGREIEISERLGELARRLLKVSDWDAIFLSGGEIAWQVINALGVRDLIPVIPVEPGILISELREPLGRTEFLITKPGGFGNIDVLRRAEEMVSALIRKDSEGASRI